MKNILKEGIWIFVATSLAACVSLLYNLFPLHVASPSIMAEPQKAVTALVGLAISIAVSYAAGLLLDPEDDAALTDDKPTTLTKRGSYVTWHMGRRRIGPLLAWAGERKTHKESMGGGKGSGGGGKQTIYSESGWHQICVGPCQSLSAVYQGGKKIFEGPITPDSHPSGTEVNLGKEGRFNIYWGESDQERNEWLGDADRVGITSRWPGLCYAMWTSKRLGTSPVWPMIEYVIERRPEAGILTDSDAYFSSGYTFPADPPVSANIYDIFTGAEGTGYLEFTGDLTKDFSPSNKIQLWDAGGFVRDEFILDIDVEIRDTNPDPNLYNWAKFTKVYITDGVSAGDASLVAMHRYDIDAEVGANPAHAIAEMLFADWPRGLGLDQDYWDIDSLEELGVLFSAQTGGEGLWSSWFVKEGKNASTALAEGLQDLGVLLPIDTASGKATFKPVRQPTSVDYTIEQDMILDPLPTREVNLGETQATAMLFEFVDQTLNWKTMTLFISDDGIAEYATRQDAKTVPINIVDHYETANDIAERRSQEMLAGGSVIKLMLSRWARTILPGDVLSVYDFEEPLRVLSVKFNPDKGAVEVQCIPDYYGVSLSSFLPNTGGGATTFSPVEADLFQIVEVPETLRAGASTTAINVMRIRAHNQITSSAIYLSDEDSSYDLLGNQDLYDTGGTLTEALADDTLHIIDEGPTFTAVGPDIAEVLDLSASPNLWRTGRQKAVINGEIFFLQKITAIPGSGDEYRLDGLIRARYDTRKEAHSIGDTVFIQFDKEPKLFTDTIFSPGNDIYVKSQPSGGAGVLPLGHIIRDSEELYGKAKVPPAPENLRLTAPFRGVKAFQTGQDLTFTWTWYSNSGAGFRDFGDPQADEEVEDQAFLQFMTVGDVVKRETLTSDSSYEYTNATMISDFGLEPSSFKVRISIIRNGWQSSTETITVEKVS